MGRRSPDFVTSCGHGRSRGRPTEVRRMREQVKPRFAVDLDEIERQLAHAQSAPAPAAYASGSPTPSRSDPLAELARIVGQDDPFRALLAGERVATHRPATEDDIFARREPLF